MTTTPSPNNQNSTTPRDNADVWVVIAAFNEEPRLSATLRSVVDAGWKNIVVVDDGSTDLTDQIASQFPCWLLQHRVNCGKGAALRTGFEFALSRGAQCIATLDADGQHQAYDIPAIVEPVLSGRADITIGSRFLGRVEDIPFHRLAVLKLATVFTRMISGVSTTDPHNGFRAFSAAALRDMRITQPRFAYASEIINEIARLKLRLEEVPVTVVYTDDTLQKGQRSIGAIKISTDLLASRVARGSVV